MATTLSNANKRTIRSLAQNIVAVCTAIPAIAAILLGAIPQDADWGVKAAAVLVSIVAGATAVTKVWNELEDRGIVDAFLKDDAAAEPAKEEVVLEGSNEGRGLTAEPLDEPEEG